MLNYHILGLNAIGIQNFTIIGRYNPVFWFESIISSISILDLNITSSLLLNSNKNNYNMIYFYNCSLTIRNILINKFKDM